MEAISEASLARVLGTAGVVESIEGVWSSWRTGRAELMASLARQQERSAADPEPLVQGLLLMESAWQKD
ncbi:unnamed protein product [Durusdinium trenchii]|uniref:Uncharacterized protein n=1 Tax=Durusdinium trenchii TaxID=1381693 RepID=A0ABP0H558_9DINO